MLLYHATTKTRLANIRTEGLHVAYADPAARMKGMWLHTKSQGAWAVLHTQRKHGAALDDVVIVEVNVPRSQLTRCRTGLWYAKTGIPASRLGAETPGMAFGASASE